MPLDFKGKTIKAGDEVVVRFKVLDAPRSGHEVRLIMVDPADLGRQLPIVACHASLVEKVDPD